MIEIIPNWHPVFVHFTVALLIIAAIIHLLSHFLPKGDLVNQLTIVARWKCWFGMEFTLLTLAEGGTESTSPLSAKPRYSNLS
jgi:uncharacterized membrane protein